MDDWVIEFFTWIRRGFKRRDLKWLILRTFREEN